jgi:leucyl aminopeptidase
MEWKGHKNKKKKPVAFIGKGVSFDTGGVSLKPSGGMEEMKYDMGGSGVVIGLMKTLALKSKSKCYWGCWTSGKSYRKYGHTTK